MSPITHFMVGWVALEKFQASKRDKAIVVLAGLAPDVDGAGIVVDFATRTLGWPETNYYQEFHRVLGHGLPAALVISAVAAACANQRLRVALCAFISVHLHFLCDIVGSRGTTTEDIWPIYYLSPLSQVPEISWSLQWPLVGWQNLVISIALMAVVLHRAAKLGYSPLALVSSRADGVLVATIRKWMLQLGGRGR